MEISAFAAKLAAETEKIILGKHDRIELIIAALLAGGHILLDDLPGVGKTTLVKLLMRFYDVQGGSITLGGVDTRDFSREDVRSQFAMVLQDTWLFSGTIRENIRYGKLDATDEEVEQARRLRSSLHHDASRRL